EGCHRSPLPYEALTGMVRERSTKKCGTRKALSQGINLRCLRDSHNHAVIVLHRPAYRAVRTTQRTQVPGFSIHPEGCMRCLIIRQIGQPCDPSAIIDAVGSAAGSSQRVKNHDPIAGGLLRRESSRRNERGSKSEYKYGCRLFVSHG